MAIAFLTQAALGTACEPRISPPGLDLRQKYHRQFQASRASASLLHLIDRLFQAPSITINQASELLDMTPQGAANNIHRLERAGVLREVTGRKRNQVFVADEIVGFMYDSPISTE